MEASQMDIHVGILLRACAALFGQVVGGPEVSASYVTNHMGHASHPLPLSKSSKFNLPGDT